MRRLSAGILFCVTLCIFPLIWTAGNCEDEVREESQKVASIIGRVVAVYGGKEVIEKIHSFHMRGNIDALVLKDKGTYLLYFKKERRLRVETKYARSAEFRILNRDRGYRGTDVLPVGEVYGARYFAMVYHYKHLNLLADIVKGTYQISYAGRTSVHGIAAEVFNFKDKEGAMMDICIDAHDFVILKVTGYFLEMKKKVYLSVEFADFRKVDGILLPFRMTNYGGGRKIAETVIEKYTLNQNIPDSLFEPTAFQSL